MRLTAPNAQICDNLRDELGRVRQDHACSLITANDSLLRAERRIQVLMRNFISGCPLLLLSAAVFTHTHTRMHTHTQRLFFLCAHRRLELRSTYRKSWTRRLASFSVNVRWLRACLRFVIPSSPKTSGRTSLSCSSPQSLSMPRAPTRLLDAHAQLLIQVLRRGGGGGGGVWGGLSRMWRFACALICDCRCWGWQQ